MRKSEIETPATIYTRKTKLINHLIQSHTLHLTIHVNTHAKILVKITVLDKKINHVNFSLVKLSFYIFFAIK